MNRPEENPDKAPLTRADAETILEIGRKRAALIGQLKEAILAGEFLLQDQISRKLCGLPRETTQ